MGWAKYFWAYRHNPPRGTTLKAIKALEDHLRDKKVVDLGAGQGNDTLAFLKAGWPVVAAEPDMVGRLFTRLRAWRAGLSQNLSCIQSPIEEIDYPRCVAVNASFSLPFCAADRWEESWQRLVAALPAGGIFAGQFFGLDDTWAKNPMPDSPSLHFSQEDIEAMFSGFDVLDFKVVNEPGVGPGGREKYWHVYHVVARKR